MLAIEQHCLAVAQHLSNLGGDPLLGVLALQHPHGER
jgi:hypothetical protein